MDSPTLINLISLLEDTTGVTGIGLLDTLESLGLDSLDHIHLILDVEDAFEIEIPEQDANGILTVAGLYDAILRAQGSTL